MKESWVSRIRLFPMMMVMAVVALTLRGVSLYTGIALMVQPAEAEEGAAQTTEHQAEDKKANDDARAEGEKTPATAPAKPPLMVGVPSTEEMQLITQLRQRREELDHRAQQLDLQQELLASTEKRINDKISQLKELEDRIKDHLKLFEKQEEQKLAQIVKVYETMRPKDAGPRFEALKLDTQVDLATRMKPAKIAAIMSQMTAQAARDLTQRLATIAQPPSIEEIQKEEKASGGGRGQGK